MSIVDIDSLDLRDPKDTEMQSSVVESRDIQNDADASKYKPMVHLHLHTFHSILDGCGSVDNYINLAKKFNHPAIAITDHGTLSGTFEFYKKCKKEGIKPILGIEAYVNDNMGAFEEKQYEGGNAHQIILIKNKQGFVNANKLVYMSFSEGFFRRQGRIKTEWLLKHKDGLVITTSCIGSKIGKLLANKDRKGAESYFKLMKDEFGDDFYAEIQINELKIQKFYNSFILEMASKYGVKVILTSDVHYAFPEDAELQDTLIAINQKSKISNSFKLDARHLFYCNSEDFHIFNYKFGYDYKTSFIDYCINNTLEIANKCNFDFEIGAEKYPKYEPTQDVIDYFKTTDTSEIIKKLAFFKLKKKLDKYRENGVVEITDEKVQQYVNRLKYEIGVIESKHMLDYFLVNWEIIREYKSKGFEIGVGRGSAAGCLLTWCLDITRIDPIRFGLYFERFLNPDRKSTPDLDIDFMSGTREINEEFLIRKYGKEKVLHVSTFTTFNEKGCLKDVVRAHYGEEATGYDSIVFQVTKEMPNWLKADYTLKEWFEQWPTKKECSPAVRQWLTDPSNKKILEQTLKLQGQIRGIGQHAAGVVITPTECWNDIPTNIVATNKSIVTAFSESDGSSKDLSELGILKLDMLSVETLNVIEYAKKLIKEKKGIDVTEQIDHVNLNDVNLYEELKIGMNQGIFQFESPGMNSLVKSINVENFDELVAASALYRPGPMGVFAHTDYIKNKFNPNSVSYVHPSLKTILEESNGVLIFQEQVMFIAQQIGGMSLGDGDMLRRCMDKASRLIDKEARGEILTPKEKSSEVYQKFLEFWNKFSNGATQNGYKKDDLDNIKNWMIKYLGYSFNKCLTNNHTVVVEKKGITQIKDVVCGDKVLGYNPITMNNEYNKVVKVHHNGAKKVYRIKTVSGKVLECTIDHKIMTENGMMTLGDILKYNMKIKTINVTIDFEKITECCEIGEIETLDLEVDSVFHNFYANNICVSNSHSVSYSYIACQTLFLKHYYPTEFYTSLLNHVKSNNDKEKEQQWIASAIASAMSKGIKILPPSRRSGWMWTMTGEKEVSMGLSGINGFGSIAYDELMSLLEKNGEKFENISMHTFFNLPLSKFNKKTFEVCVKAGVFDDWADSREYLLELKSKKRQKRQPGQMALFDLSSEEFDSALKNEKFVATTQEQKDKEFIDVCNFDLKKIHEMASIKEELKKRAGRTIESILNFSTDDYYFFYLNSVQEVMTDNGKKYLSLKVGDGISETKLNMFQSRKVSENKIYEQVKNIQNEKGVYVSEFTKNQKGFINFKINAKFKRVK